MRKVIGNIFQELLGPQQQDDVTCSPGGKFYIIIISEKYIVQRLFRLGFPL
jgi:hypothetical protein